MCSTNRCLLSEELNSRYSPQTVTVPLHVSFLLRASPEGATSRRAPAAQSLLGGFIPEVSFPSPSHTTETVLEQKHENSHSQNLHPAHLLTQASAAS